jgi:isoaspartyl peptidase/L-asparaginase-like protein (Ntn-hydrolase superfamily)
MIMFILALFACEPLDFSGLGDGHAKSSPAAPPVEPAPAAAIAHGGVGSRPEVSDGVRAAVDAALAALEAGASPVDAAVAGVEVMEDDPRFNAGTGSRVRIDGETVQMDASVMISDGTFGAVSVIEHVQHPIRVARAVVDTPHILIAGDGATRFARALGMPEYDVATPENIERTRQVQEKLRTRDPSLPESWKDFDWPAKWNFERTLEELGIEPGSDTVGVAVRGADGSFGVALSTGGTNITLRGRVGDVPILGAGLYAGPNGAVAATGTGERIVEAGLSRAVYNWLEDGGPQSAADRGVEAIRDRGSVGLIVIGTHDLAASADRKMAWAARELGSDDWSGPEP